MSNGRIGSSNSGREEIRVVVFLIMGNIREDVLGGLSNEAIWVELRNKKGGGRGGVKIQETANES